MADLKDLLARAKASTKEATQQATASATKTKNLEEPKAHTTKIESVVSEDSFDELNAFASDLSDTAVPPNFNSGLSKDGQQLEVGDPVVGINKGQNMSGQVIAIDGNNATVEWKNKDVTTVPSDMLEMTNVDDDYEEEAMYIESREPRPTMGFDKESFVEDTDLESLLRGDSQSSFKYDARGDL